MSDARIWKSKAVREFATLFPRPTSTLTSLLQTPVPDVDHRALELAKRGVVRRHPVVVVVTEQHLREVCLLHGHRGVTSSFTFLCELGELSSPLLPGGSPSANIVKMKVPFPRKARRVAFSGSGKGLGDRCNHRHGAAPPMDDRWRPAPCHGSLCSIGWSNHKRALATSHIWAIAASGPIARRLFE